MKQPVLKNNGTVPVENILCTTYQMRNFYLQFRDGFFTNLDVMNYIQHLTAVRLMRSQTTVLDVCCGRSLLLPLMRYHAKNVRQYIGVDIEAKNIVKEKDIRTGKPIDPNTWYPFKVTWIESNVSKMSQKIEEKSIDMAIYTSAIEHMHKDDGKKSLNECAKLLKPQGKLFLSCPNTPKDQNGFDVRYAAHVYEWKLSELTTVLKKYGLVVREKYGLVGNIREFKKKIYSKFPKLLRDHYDVFLSYLPREFVTAMIFLPYPEIASEVLLICEKT
jgi:ubiquinone/menaquinone biosynthesis C-methylase UbiE